MKNYLKNYLTMLVLAIGMLLGVSAEAAGFLVIDNGENDVENPVASFVPASMLGGSQLDGFNLLGQPQTKILSAPYHQSANDPTLVLNRLYSMTFLTRGVVPMDRIMNPASVHVLEGKNFQLYDGAGTIFHSWVGRTNIPTMQYGHRLNFPLFGTGRVSGYWNRITTSSTNYVGGFFPVGTNSAGVEINLGPNFMALSKGPNGNLDSAPDPITGGYTRGGDDVLYTSGSPSDPAKNIDIWWRLGASAVIVINSTSGFDSLRQEFAGQGTNLTIRSELGKFDNNGVFVVMASSEIVAATAKIDVTKENDNVVLQAKGGQDLLRYGFEVKTTAGGEWNPLDGGALHLSNVPFVTPNTGGQAYFRCKQVP